MRRLWLVLLTLACMVHSSSSPRSLRAQQEPTAIDRAIERYGRVPLSFEKNEGQTDARVAFLSRGSGYALFLMNTGGEAVLAVRAAAVDRSPGRTTDVPGRAVPQGAAVRIRPVGARPARAEARDRLPGAVHYLVGTDRTRWRGGVPTYARVAYSDIYPGVDLVYYGNQRQLEYDLIVRPGADPRAIALEAEGADRLEIDAGGDLVMHVASHEIRQQKPIVYQVVSGVRHAREGRYRLQGANRVTFELGAFDPTVPLVIDPVLVYSTFLGGSLYEVPDGNPNDSANGIAVDAAGYVYVTGGTTSADLPTTMGAFDETFNSTRDTSADVYVTKFEPNGATAAYSTFIGGRDGEEGRSIAVDTSGRAHVTGLTNSRDFPTTAAAFDRIHNGGNDAFVIELDAAGAALVHSTFLGGSENDAAYGIAMGADGAVYLAGTTNSPGFPTSPGAFDRMLNGGGTDPLASDAFVTTLSPSGTLVYSTFLGGRDYDSAADIAVDAGGRAHVTGSTHSVDFPATAGAFDTTFNGGDNDAFVTALNATGTALEYSTFLGSASVNHGAGIAVDAAGNAYVTGATGSGQGPTEFPTTAGAYDTTPNGDWDVFVTKLNPTGTLVYSTLIGGQISDLGNDITVDAGGQAYVLGVAYGGGFPITPGAYDTTGNGNHDAVVVKVNGSGSALLYSTYLGGSSLESPAAIAIDPTGNVYVAGRTRSSNFPTTSGAFDTSANGGYDAFVTKLNAAGSALVFSTYFGGHLQVGGNTSGLGIAVDDAGSAYVTGNTGTPDFPTTVGAFDTNWGGPGGCPFVAKLDPTGTSLIYSTFLGGTAYDTVAGIAVDATGHAYVAGWTASDDFPTTAGAYDTSLGYRDAFIVKLDPSGGALTYSTLLGGTNSEELRAIAIDAAGQAYVTGDTSSTDFPVTPGGYDQTHNGDIDGFVTKLNATGTAVIYSTFIGGTSQELVKAIAVDAGGGAYVTGYSRSVDFPATAGAFDSTHNGGTDAFVTKLDAAGSTLAYSTFLGGTSRDSGEGIALDAAGNAYVTGMTASADFPITAGAYDTTLNPPSDVFVAKLDPAGATLAYSTFLGGSSLDSGTAIAVDASGRAWATGATGSADFPTTAGALDPTWNLSADVFVAQLDAAGSSVLYSTFLGGTSSDSGLAIALDQGGNVYLTGDTASRYTFPATAGAYDTTPNGGSDAFVAKFSETGAPRPRVIVTANGGFGPLTLTAGNSLVVDVSFDAAGNVLSPGEVYVGVSTPSGVFWLDPVSQRFIPTPLPYYAGPVSNFGPVRIVNLANVGVLQPGTYLWFMAVDRVANGQPDVEFFDGVAVVVQ